MLFSDFFQSLNASLIHIETPLFLSRNTCVQTGVVADDVGVNATSVLKPLTECHFFVKSVMNL